jgi:hypothetical protein
MDRGAAFPIIMGVICTLLIGVALGQIITVADVYAMCQKEGRYVHASIWFKEKQLTINCTKEQP